jgi:ABC-type molybdate transport system permease subunit
VCIRVCVVSFNLVVAEPLVVAQAEAALDTLNEKVCVYTCVCVVSCNLVVAEPLVVAQAEAALDTLNKKVCVCICVCCKLQPGCC